MEPRKQWRDRTAREDEIKRRTEERKYLENKIKPADGEKQGAQSLEKKECEIQWEHP